MSSLLVKWHLLPPDSLFLVKAILVTVILLYIISLVKKLKSCFMEKNNKRHPCIFFVSYKSYRTSLVAQMV